LLNAANRDRVENLESLIKFFLEDERWHAFLKLCLDVGNVVNFNDKRRGGAHGFKFATLKSFGTCKSSDGKQYLLPYLFEKIGEQHFEGLEFYPEMRACITGALTYELDDVISNIGSLKAKFTKLKSLLEFSEKANPKDENFISNFEPFYLDNVKDTVDLEVRALGLKEKLVDMAVKYGDDPKKIKGAKSTDIIKEYDKIFAEFGKSIEDIIKAKEKEKKQADKKAKKEKKARIDDD
jgi:hypothetical protein